MNAANVVIGTINAGATTIYSDVSGQPTAAGDPPWAARFVTLDTDYAMAGPLSFPSRPSFTGADATDLRTIPSGTHFQTFACEAAALVAAGAATYS